MANLGRKVDYSAQEMPVEEEERIVYPSLHLSDEQMTAFKGLEVGEEFEATVSARVSGRTEEAGGYNSLTLEIVEMTPASKPSKSETAGKMFPSMKKDN